ncbi:NTP transferase domain-containing protein [Aristaeella hokkaidonensis]|uniref:NTP transferase domain-containing protein n=1 Tax=Aristaeella hokkaidonensis TaxID=3046382 RepID=A0AC61MY19_9FIRM|nr:NTP transferase domain-containing protein [Aristaeella hokkaidonensis]QUC66688.1 NTP transferase domain-containing protein [Aristaeella hokkaidonensis]
MFVKDRKGKKKEQLSIQESDVLSALYDEPFVNQRILAETSGHSLGVVNRSLRSLMAYGYLNEEAQLTEKAEEMFKACAPRNAIILAAGFGMRMVPINLSTPKAFLEVNGEKLIERTIRQLKEVGVQDITVVVGFMKDSFEYLIDEYGVELVYNPDFASANNIRSLGLVLDRLSNTYIIPCDIWCDRNPFRKNELYSWYMVSDLIDNESTVRVNRKTELVTVPEDEPGNGMIGISYLLDEDAAVVCARIEEMISEGKHDEFFWEAALYEKDRMFIRARVVHGPDAVEINTYEQLRELDSHSNQLKSDAIRTIAQTLNCGEQDIKEITVLKKGMTNRSFLFTVSGAKYIMRIPGEGTDQLINRKQEAEVFRTISGLGLCDDPVYINPENGYKITRYLEGIRACDSESIPDLNRCMEKLRQFHEMKLTVPHSFDIFGQIEFYESLWEGNPSVYRDYAKTKENALSLRLYIDQQEKDWCLTHIDAVPDNFLFYTPEGSEEEQLQLTDWEYSGMQDPHVDIAMFCIYSLYDKQQCDRLIDIYFNQNCPDATRAKIYCYIAVCGLLWSNWCEYKRKLGVEFGEYSLRQYRYAKDFYRYAKELIEQMGGKP